jgi:hypothetical protein
LGATCRKRLRIVPVVPWYADQAMKNLKFLLLIVALLLPFRGAMAAVGMYCHLGSSDAMSTIVEAHHHDAGISGHDAANGGGHAHHEAGASAPHEADSDSPPPLADTCAYCAASCAAAPLVPASLTMNAPILSGAERFPALATPHLHSVSDGLERPPRTI